MTYITIAQRQLVKKHSQGANVLQKLRAPTALVEDPGFVPVTMWCFATICKSSARRSSTPFFTSAFPRHTCGVYTCMQAKYSRKLQIKISKHRLLSQTRLESSTQQVLDGPHDAEAEPTHPGTTFWKPLLQGKEEMQMWEQL